MKKTVFLSGFGYYTPIGYDKDSEMFLIYTGNMEPTRMNLNYIKEYCFTAKDFRNIAIPLEG